LSSPIQLSNCSLLWHNAGLYSFRAKASAEQSLQLESPSSPLFDGLWQVSIGHVLLSIDRNESWSLLFWKEWMQSQSQKLLCIEITREAKGVSEI
jgi:hypothetical protein